MKITGDQGVLVFIQGLKQQDGSENTQKHPPVDTNKSLADYEAVLKDFASSANSASSGDEIQAHAFTNLPAVYLGGVAKAHKRKDGQDCVLKYLSILNELRNEVYNYGLLITLPLKKLELLHRLNEHLSKELEVGKITEEYASWAKEILSQQFTLELQQTTNEQIDQSLPTALWPQDKEQGERAIDFLMRIWGKHIESGSVLRSDIRTKNLSLYQALSTNFRRNSIPKEIKEWWSKSPIRSKKEIDEKLEALKILNPEDAFKRNLNTPEAHRLYNAASRRKSKIH